MKKKILTIIFATTLLLLGCQSNDNPVYTEFEKQANQLLTSANQFKVINDTKVSLEDEEQTINLYQFQIINYYQVTPLVYMNQENNYYSYLFNDDQSYQYYQFSKQLNTGNNTFAVTTLTDYILESLDYEIKLLTDIKEYKTYNITLKNPNQYLISLNQEEYQKFTEKYQIIFPFLQSNSNLISVDLLFTLDQHFQLEINFTTQLDEYANIVEIKYQLIPTEFQIKNPLELPHSLLLTNKKENAPLINLDYHYSIQLATNSHDEFLIFKIQLPPAIYQITYENVDSFSISSDTSNLQIDNHQFEVLADDLYYLKIKPANFTSFNHLQLKIAPK